MKDMIARLELERKEEWSRWAGEIPAIEFKDGWKVKVIPAMGGAMARFRVVLDSAHVSVYLDVNDSLGCVGEPYWEAYPYEGDIYRCCMNEVDELVTAIDASLAEQLVGNKD